MLKHASHMRTYIQSLFPIQNTASMVCAFIPNPEKVEKLWPASWTWMSFDRHRHTYTLPTNTRARTHTRTSTHTHKHTHTHDKLLRSYNQSLTSGLQVCLWRNRTSYSSLKDKIFNHWECVQNYPQALLLTTTITIFRVFSWMDQLIYLTDFKYI